MYIFHDLTTSQRLCLPPETSDSNNYFVVVIVVFQDSVSLCVVLTDLEFAPQARAGLELTERSYCFCLLIEVQRLKVYTAVPSFSI